MKLTHFIHSPVATFALAMLPLAALIDRAISFVVNVFDELMPAPIMAADWATARVASRDVTYLTTGVHRLAQPVLRRGGDDDDDGEDVRGGVLSLGDRLNC